MTIAWAGREIAIMAAAAADRAGQLDTQMFDSSHADLDVNACMYAISLVL